MKILIAEFSQLSEEFDENKNLLHLQMAAFSHLTQNAIDKYDLELLKKCYKLAADIFENSSPDVENAIYVSYLEHLEFENSIYGETAKELLPPILKLALKELEEHFKKLAESYNAGMAE